jgi:hypothetical protein
MRGAADTDAGEGRRNLESKKVRSVCPSMWWKYLLLMASLALADDIGGEVRGVPSRPVRWPEEGAAAAAAGASPRRVDEEEKPVWGRGGRKIDLGDVEEKEGEREEGPVWDTVRRGRGIHLEEVEGSKGSRENGGRQFGIFGISNPFGILGRFVKFFCTCLRSDDESSWVNSEGSWHGPNIYKDTKP